MADLAALSALADETLNERLHLALKPGATRGLQPDGRLVFLDGAPPAYASDSSPRSLLNGVLAEVRDRDVERQFVKALDLPMDESVAWFGAFTATARQITIAAIAALEGD
jgi:hypothetical protein